MLDGINLTEKQKRFCDYYIEDPNATQAAIRAGYSKKTARFIGNENLTKPNIQDYISIRNKQLESQRIADMIEIKEFWTTTMREEEQDLKERLRASEYLAKTNGAFIDKVEQTGDFKLKVEWLDED